jgi:hypothetical protein
MSIISSLLIPMLEKELAALEPIAQQAIINLVKGLGHEVVAWAESKLHIDIDGDGKIGK